MKKATQIVQAIRSLLEGGGLNAAAEKTAADYFHLCTEAEQRLEMVAAMLAKGSDYQALQIAEQEPALLDLVAALSFGGERAWQEFCEEHHLPEAPRLSAKTVQSLDALYAKGITANHPLYKDFRASVLSRDDAKSLQILHTILKLNPTDENAKKELQRLDNKRLQEKVEQLREALKTDDEEHIASLTEGLAAMASQEKLQRFDIYVSGEAIRRALRKRQAGQRLPIIMEQMIKQQAEQDWQAVGAGLDEWSALQEEFGLEVPQGDLQEKLAMLRQFYAEESAANLQRRSFEKVLRNCVAYADEVEIRLKSGSLSEQDEVVGMADSFARQWKEVEGHNMTVPKEVAHHLEVIGHALNLRLARIRRARLMRKWTAIAAIFGGLACVTAVIMHGWKAHVLSEELVSYQSRHLCLPAEERIRMLRQEDGWLLRWPYLQARVDEVDSWTHQMRATEDQVHNAVKSLSSSFANDSTRLPPALLMRQLGDAEALLKLLPRDLVDEPRNQLVALRTRVDSHLSRLGKQLTSQADTALVEIEQKCAASLSFEKPAAQVAESVRKLSRELAPFEAKLKPETEALRLPIAVESRILGLRQRLNLFQDEVLKFEKVRVDTAAVESLPTYKSALTKWKEIQFAEAVPAAKTLSMLPTESRFLASLLTKGDESVLKAVLEDVSGPRMQPAAPTNEDLKTLLSIRDDFFLNNIWENRMADYTHGGAESTWWSIGKPVRANIGENVRWSARFYDLGQSSPSVIFVKRDVVRIQASRGYIGIAVLDSKPSPTGAFVNSLHLNRMTDESGQHYIHSLLDAFEGIVRNVEGSPIARAYVMLKLEGMLRQREQNWGLHFCPSLQDDLRELHQILGENRLQSESWLVVKTRDEFTAPLAAFFKKCEARHYLREATARRTLLRSAAGAGLRFGGYVEVDKTMVLKHPARNVSELWVLDKTTGRPSSVANTGNAKVVDGVVIRKAENALPLSPVFYLPVDRQSLLKQYQASMAATKAEPLQAPSGESPFIIHP